MRLQTLEITDFRSIRSAVIEFARVNWILGDNFSGKTSAILALEAALLARASKYAVNAEARSAKVELSLEANGHTVSLALSRFLSKSNIPIVNGRGIPRNQYVEAMRDLLGVTAPVLEAVLASGKFMNSDPQVQASLVLDAAGVTSEWAEAEAAFAEWCEEQKIESFRLDEVLTPIRLSGLSLVDEIYDTAYKLRTDANREASLEAQPAPEPDTDIIQYVGNPGLLQALRDEDRTLSERRPRLQQLRSQFRTLEAIEAGEDPEAALGGIDLDDLQRRGNVQRARRAAIQEADSAVESARAARDAAKKIYDALDSGNCPFGVKCEFKTKWAADEWARLESDLSSLEGNLKTAEAARAGLPAVDEREIQALRDEKARLDKLKQDVQVRREVRAALGGHDSAAVELELEQVDGRKGEVTRLLELVRVHARALEHYEGVTTRRAKAALKASRLDTIVKGFDKPIRFKMVDEVMSRFVGPMTDALHLFFGEDFEFMATATGGFSIEVLKSGKALPFEELSKSEQVMVSTAAQHAISQLAGVGILIIDAADTMRGKALQRFIRGLYRLSQGYETVVVASTTGHISPELSPLRNIDKFPDTQLLIVGNGTITALPQVPEKVLKALQ